MEMKGLSAIVVASASAILCVIVAAQAHTPLTSILFPSKGLLDDFVVLAGGLFILSAGQALAYRLSQDRLERVLLGIIPVITSLFVVPLGGSEMAEVFMLSAAVSILAFQYGTYKGWRGLWAYLGHVRGVGALIVFLVVMYIATTHATTYQRAFTKALLSFAMSQAVPQGTNIGSVIDKLVPDTITPKEKAHIDQAIRTEYPNFDSLPPQVQRQIEQNFINMYLKIKEQIKDALKVGFSKVDMNTLSREMQKSVETMPIFRTIMKYAGALFALAASFIYSIAAWIATFVCFLTLLPVWRHREEHN